ncbi:MAG: universal stress protein [Alphaproteobacteria bacterium]|nr:universal stress protein [Alphaproteobacteria bacterium]
MSAKRLKQNRQAHRFDELNPLLERYSLVLKTHEVHLLQAYAGDVVPKLAARLRVDLVVMGTIGRTDAGGLLIGNTAEMILGRPNCSVLAVKPPDFRTPVSSEHTTRQEPAYA